MRQRHIIARSRGITDGNGCICVVCGPSPFDATDWKLGTDFSDWDDVAGVGDVVCSGCASILRGRPGDDPPPLRTVHILAVEGESAAYPSRDAIEAILRDPPAKPFVLAIAESRQRHAALRAGVSSAHRLLIGTDGACVVYEPARHLDLLDAVAALCIPGPKQPGFTREQIKSGQYGAAQIITFGAMRWEALERIIAPHRPSNLLDLLCLIARSAPATRLEIDMIDPVDETAAHLLAEIARVATVNKIAVNFWGGFLLHRITRFADQPLSDMVSRLMGACSVPPLSGVEIVSMLNALPPEEMVAVSAAFRARAPLIVALAFEMTRPTKPAPKAAQESLWKQN